MKQTMGTWLLKIARKLFFIDFIKGLTPSDRIAFLALLTSIITIFFSSIQFRESQRQFNLQIEYQRKKDQEDDANFNEQIKRIENKNFEDRKFYDKQLHLAALRDSFEREKFKRSFAIEKIKFNYQRRSDSVQILNQVTNQHIAVRPQIAVETDSFGSEGNFGINFSNVGLGPAIITKLDIYYRGQKLPKTKSIESYPTYYREDKFFKSDRDMGYWDYWDTTFTMSPNKTIWLIHTSEKNVENPYLLSSVLEDKIGIIIEYKSFYGDRYRFSWNEKAIKSTASSSR